MKKLIILFMFITVFFTSCGSNNELKTEKVENSMKNSEPIISQEVSDEYQQSIQIKESKM